MGGCRTLKAEKNDTSVVLEVPLGIIRNVRTEFGKAIRKDYEAGNIKISRHKFLKHEVREDGIVNTLDSVQKDNCLAIKVKQATKQGYAIARGARFGQPCSPRKQNKKRESRGRYGKHIGHELQSGDIC